LINSALFIFILNVVYRTEKPQLIHLQ
jgi:hypothetical protein